MKKLLFSSLLFFLVFQAQSWAACSVGTPEFFSNGTGQVTVTCEGSGSTDEVTVAITSLEGYGTKTGYFVTDVTAWTPAGGTAPDEADVLIFDTTVDSTIKQDMLGSTDGTTAVNGLGLIDSGLVPQRVKPVTTNGSEGPMQVYGDILVRVVNQATAGADYKIRIGLFSK
jgi:hypothetical protein